MFCCTLLYVHSSLAIILMGRESWLVCLVCFSVMWLFLTVPWFCLQFVIMVFPDHTHLLFYVIFEKDVQSVKQVKADYSLLAVSLL